MSDDSKDESAKARRAGPVAARSGPYEVPVEEGRQYRWCSCGRSATQPWCDDSHTGTGMEPITFIAPLSAIFFMCGCKRSDNPPFCFGTCRGHGRASRG